MQLLQLLGNCNGHIDFNCFCSVCYLESPFRYPSLQKIFFSKQVICQSSDNIDLTRSQSGRTILFHVRKSVWCSMLTMESFPCFTQRKDFNCSRTTPSICQVWLSIHQNAKCTGHLSNDRLLFAALDISLHIMIILCTGPMVTIHVGVQLEVPSACV